MPSRTHTPYTSNAEDTTAFEKKKPSILEELSFSQLAAGALAAVTSLLLSSRIGVAGSVIGAAVGYVVTAVSGVVFKRVISASAEKVKQSADKIKAASATGATALSPALQRRDTATAGTTQPMPAAHAAASSRTGRVAPEALREKAAQERSDERSAVQKKIVIASIAAGLVAVAVIAGAVMLFTNGSGLGPKPEAVFTPAPQEELVEDSSTSQAPNADTDSKPSDNKTSAGNVAHSNASSDATDAHGTGTTSSDSPSNSTTNSGSSNTGTGGDSSSDQQSGTGESSSAHEPGTGSGATDAGSTNGESSGSAGSTDSTTESGQTPDSTDGSSSSATTRGTAAAGAAAQALS